MKKILKNSQIQERSLVLQKLPGVFLIACLLASIVFFFKLLWPFLTVIFVAAVLAITFYPLYRGLLKVLRGWQSTASIITCVIVILVTVVPISVFTVMIADQGVQLYDIVQKKVESGMFDKYLQWESGGFFYDIKDKVSTIVNLEDLNLKTNILKFAQNLSGYLVSQAGMFLKGLSDFMLKVFVLLFAMFYFFRDGDRIVDKLRMLSPLPEEHEIQLMKKVGAMVKAIVLGVFLTAIAQGLVGGIGFAIVGVSGALFWGTAMALFSLLPLVGTALIWGPAAIILIIMGNYGSAIFIVIWGILVIGTVDNFLRPYLIGGKAHTYPLLTFLVILGGIWTLGFKGIIVGPLVLMIMMSFLHIYEIEYSKVLKK